MPPEEHEESQYNHYISEVRNFRMHLEAHEEHLIRKIRTPLDRDDLEQSQLRISEQEVRTSTAKYTKYTNTQIHQINNGSNFVFVPLMYLWTSFFMSINQSIVEHFLLLYCNTKGKNNVLHNTNNYTKTTINEMHLRGQFKHNKDDTLLNHNASL